MIHQFLYKFLKQYKKLLSACIILIISFSTSGQEVKKIEIVNAKLLRQDLIHGPDVQILNGNVILKHDSALMFCDSAYYNTRENNFTAFGKIHILSPTEDMQDTVHLWGESLDYYGKDKLAQVRKNVVMKKDSMTLYTQSLDYDISKDIGKYLTGGRTISGQDTLVSQRGYFYANEDEIYFKEKVRIYNPKYTIFTDTLKHNTKRKISYMLSPTNIVSKDTSSSFLHCENGFYNHGGDFAQFQKNAYLVHGKQILLGDSLYYNRKDKIGKAYQHVRAVDSTQNAILTGNYGEYNEKTQSYLMTDKAVFLQIQKEDTLFLHADTLLSLKDTLITKTDTTGYSLIKAFHKVKIFRSNFQAKCDSLIYTTLDSTISLFRKPVMWSSKYQITSEFIKVFTKHNEINQVKMFDNSLIVQQSDTIRFDQTRGKNMIAYIEDNQLKKIDVFEDGASIFFGRDKNKLIGVNKITCKNMVIYMDSSQVDKIWFYQNPDATLYPPFYLPKEELVFENFQWLDKIRPKNKTDIFIWEDDGKSDDSIKKEADKNKTIKLEDIGKEQVDPNKQSNKTKTPANKSQNNSKKGNVINNSQRK
jgi:lipopolysaccharide export system protein LptA